MLLCRRAGVEFAPADPFADTAWLPFPMSGHPQHGTENVVWDPRVGQEVRAFDYWFREPSDDRPSGPTRRLTCAVMPLGFACSRLRIEPRDLLDEAAAALGRPEVRVELETFDRRFRVEAEDPRFAMAFLDQRMMEALLALPGEVTIELNEDVLLLTAPRMPAERVLLLLECAIAIRRHLPRDLASLFPSRPADGPHERRWLQGRWTPEPTGDAEPATSG
jgi:hypothetical protein